MARGMPPQPRIVASADVAAVRILTRQPPVRRKHRPIPPLVRQTQLVIYVPAPVLGNVIRRVPDVLMHFGERLPPQRERMSPVHIPGAENPDGE